MENVIKLILSTLPRDVYRDFDHRFSMQKKNDDDINFDLHIDILSNGKVRVYYYGDNSLSMSIHEEYWNGERHETFSDGGFVVDASSITKGRLESWFYRVFRLDPPTMQNIAVDGLDQKLQLIFSVLENKVMNDMGEQYDLIVTVCPVRKKPGIDIHYLNTKTMESIWLMDGSIIDPHQVTKEFLKDEYQKGVKGFKPCRL